MAGQSGKKQNKKKASNRLFWKALILVITCLYILINAYNVIFNEYKYTRGNTLEFLSLTIINFILYRMLDMTLDSMFFNYVIDFLVINLAVMLLINFHWKFWFLYLSIPAYGLVKLGMYTYDHVKSVGKEDPNEEPVDPRQGKGKNNSSKEKKEKKVIIRN